MAKITPEVETKLKDGKALSIISLAGSFIEPIAGLISGYVALNEYKKIDNHETPWRKIALTGVILSWVNLIFRIKLFMFIFFIMIPLSIMHNSSPYYYYDYPQYGGGHSYIAEPQPDIYIEPQPYTNPYMEPQVDPYMMIPEGGSMHEGMMHGSQGMMGVPEGTFTEPMVFTDNLR